MKSAPKTARAGGPQKTDRRVYTGQSLRCVAMPMGGIGAGQIALCGDGSLRQWQIWNVPNHQAYVPDSLFMISARVRGKRMVSRILQSAIAHDEKGFTPAQCVSDHIVPEQLRGLMKSRRGVESIEYTGEYPIAGLRYVDKDLPVDVRLESFCPMIPLNSKDSGLPAIIFNFTVTNPNDKRCDVSFAATLQNAVGYDGIAQIEGTRCPLYGGNVNAPLPVNGTKGVLMSKLGLPIDDARYGTMALAVFDEGGSVRLRWEDLAELERDFMLDGRFTELAPIAPSPEGRTWNGAIAAPFSLEPGAEHTVTFVVAWHFANRYVNWQQDWFGVPESNSRYWLGNMYGNWFRDAAEVTRYVRDNFDRLCSETRAYRDALYKTSLPYYVLDAVSSQISTVRSPSCFWTEDGRLHGFEGCHGESTGEWRSVGGCCPMNCTHVWNYEQAVAKVFPDLMRTMRETDLVNQMDCCGAIPHRTVLPLSLPRWSAEGKPEDTGVFACDGHFGTILKTYREVLVSGDPEYLKHVWPRVKSAMAFAFKHWDPDGDGVCDVDRPQWNTYDLNYYGWNSFIGTWYLAALRAAEEMALAMGERNVAQEYRRRFESGREIISTVLWNGEYYVQKYDAKRHPDYQFGDGCLSDQLIGQWWAHVVGLGYILPPEQVKKTLQSIHKYNFRRNLKGVEQQPRVFAREPEAGLIMCTWPKGGRPKEPMFYCDEVWSGTEYQVAAHMIYEGMVDEGMELVKAARDRYNGEYRSPWNEVECGDHYVRPMSSWSLLEAAGGYRWDGLAKTMHIGPNVRGVYEGFATTGSGWGMIEYAASSRGVRVSVSVVYGTIDVKSVVVKVGRRKAGRAQVMVNGKKSAAKVKPVDGDAVVTLRRAASLKPGDTLAIVVS
jgi:non-lysosomal glucosylceramidase